MSGGKHGHFLRHRDKRRDQLLLELTKLDEIAALTAWAHRTLPRKNELTNPDATKLEEAFTERLTKLAAAASGDEPQDTETRLAAQNGHERATGADSKEVIVLSKPVRDRDRIHLKFVASQPCLLCGRTPSDPHHIKFAENWTAGRKVSDRFTVPLCRLHHHELHRRGNERAWWQQKGIDPLPVAKALWDKTHAPEPDQIGLLDRAELVQPLPSDETKPIAGSEPR